MQCLTCTLRERVRSKGLHFRIYFGLQFCSLNATLDYEYNNVPFGQLANLVSTPECTDFMKEIRDDMMCLHGLSVRCKKEWNASGLFLKVHKRNKYAYAHKQHAACSSVPLSVLQATNWRFDKEWEYVDNVQCDHADHHRLAPFFHDNRYLEKRFTRLVQGENPVAQLLLEELNDTEEKLQNRAVVNVDSEFWHPEKLANN